MKNKIAAIAGLTARVVWLLGLLLLVTSACSKKVKMPPRIDLTFFDVIGLIEFTSDAEGNLPAFTTQKFLAAIQASQPGLQVLELGSQQRLLQTENSNELDLTTIKAIGVRQRVSALFAGHLDVTDVRPSLRVPGSLTSISLSAEVEATLTARLYDTSNGATLWTSSATGKGKVAHASLDSGGIPRFDASDPENAYAKLAHALVYEITRDFRERWEKQ